jgi:hypothetical protein
MSQSRKVIKDFSSIYLDGLALDTTALGALTLGGNEIGSGSGMTGSSFSNLYVAESITTGSLVIGIEGTAIELDYGGAIKCNKIVGSTGSSLGNLYIDEGVTAGSLTIGTVEGVAASISDGGIVTCFNITPSTFSPPVIRATQGTSISTGVNTYYNQFGSILTVSNSVPPQGSAQFSVTNTYVTADTSVISNIVRYTGTEGLPSVYVSNVANGLFTVSLVNNSVTDSLNGAVEIGFIALKPRPEP